MMSKKAKEILNYIREKAPDLEIRLNYHVMAKYNGEEISSGYFEAPEFNKELKQPLLVKNQTEKWKEYSRLYHQYLRDEKETRELTIATVDMESECEQNTIKLAKEINYDINPELYTKKVNAYLVFYNIYLDTLKWYKKAPFENQKILEMMPNMIIEKPMEYKISDNLRTLYFSCLK